MKKWVKRFIKLPMVAVVLALLLSYGSCFIHPSTYGYFMVFGLFYPLILAAAIITLITYLFVRPLYGVLIILAIGLGLPWWPVYFSLGSNPDKSDENYSFVTFNAQAFYSKNDKGTRVFSEEAIKSWVDSSELTDADIITIQENNSGKTKEIANALGTKFNSANGSPRISMYAQYPFADVLVRKGNNATNGFYEVTVYTEKDTLEVISVHLQSNRLRSSDVNSLNDGAWTGKTKYQSLWHSIKSYQQHAVDRAEQVEFILERVKKSKYPVIVAGDFNDVPMSYISHQMRSELVDAYSVAGRGLSSTLRSLSGLKIDYIYVSKDLNVHDCHVIRSGHSDHYPVFASWSFN